MAKKITLSELKVKSSVTELNSNARKFTKGGHVQHNHPNADRIKIVPTGDWIADTIVDIRLTTTKDGGDLNP